MKICCELRIWNFICTDWHDFLRNGNDETAIDTTVSDQVSLIQKR